MGFAAIPAETEAMARVVVDAGVKVHSAVGPGLLESAYEHCLAHELSGRGLDVRRQVGLPITYRGRQLDVGYRIDLWVGRNRYHRSEIDRLFCTYPPGAAADLPAIIELSPGLLNEFQCAAVQRWN